MHLRQLDYLIRFADVTTVTAVVPTIDNVKYMGDLNIPPWSTTFPQRYWYYPSAMWLNQGAVLSFHLNTTIRIPIQQISIHFAQYQGSTAKGFSVRSLPSTPYACTAGSNMFASAGASVTEPYNSGGYANGVYTAEMTGVYQFNYCA